MVSHVPGSSSWLGEYADRLVRLHWHISQGQGDSDAADEVRDEMDLPWRRMSEDEIQLMSDLSVDLYSITDPPCEVQPLQHEFKSSLNDVLDRQAYRDALGLVRENAAQLDPSAAAFLRGVCWSGLGFPSAAAEFFMHAERCQPGMLETRLCALSCLISSSREKEALDHADKWARETDHPALLLKAAEVEFLNAVRFADERSLQLFRQTIMLAERALEAGKSDYITDAQITIALLQIAVSHFNLGDISKAKAYCFRAREQSPDSVVAMMVDGMLNDAAPPFSSAARLEVARSIVPPIDLGSDSPVVQHAEQFRQIFALN